MNCGIGGRGRNSAAQDVVISHGKDVLVESNVIDHTVIDQGLRFSNCTFAQFFNNQQSTGQLLRGCTGTSSRQELEDFAEDSLRIL